MSDIDLFGQIVTSDLERKREKYRRDARKYRERHPDKLRARKKKEQQKNAERYRQRAREWQVRNPERAEAHKRQWARRNAEQIAERSRLRFAANPQKVRQQKRAYIERHRERYLQNRAASYKKNIKTARTYHYFSTYGIKLTDYPQPNCCQICKTTNVKLVFDHCHRTGIARGWICQPCNVTMGFAKENPARLRACADWLEHHDRPTQSTECSTGTTQASSHSLKHDRVGAV